MEQKVILFDLDGTLTDSGEGIINCVVFALEHYGLPVPSKAELRSVVGPPLHDTLARYGVPKEKLDEAVTVFRSRYNPIGIYENVPYPGIREALEELVRQNSSLGLDVRMVYGQDIRELIPDVSPEVQYATYCPTDGHANPMRTTLALYKRARELGAQFITNIKVLKLEKVAGRIRRVHTDDGIYEADSVILCAGFGSRKIMRTVGLDVPMLPQLTEAFVTEPIPAVTDKFISAADGCFYAQQQRNGTWVIGGDSNYEIYDATYPREVTFSFSAPRIARFFLEYMPTLKGVKVIRSWSGQLDMCWDGSPVISPVEEVEGLYVGCAFTGHGFGIGPAAGYVLAQMAVGEAPAVDLSGLRYDRFRLPSH